MTGTATEYTLRQLLAELEAPTLPTDAATQTTLATLATDAKLELVRLLLVSLDGTDFATQTTLSDLLTELQLKADLTETQPVSVADWPGTPAIYNVPMTNADQEYSQALPSNTRKFLIKCRTSFAIKLSFTAEASGTTYLTVPADMAYWEDQINDAAITLYFQCATAAKVAEIVAWS